MIYYLGIAVFAAAVLMCIEIYRELHHFSVVHYQIKTPKFPAGIPEQKIVFLSDLHNHEYGDHNEKLVNAIKAVKPDMILVTGDMLVGKKGRSFDKAASFMTQLPQIAPVYYANGNHEQRMHENEEYYGDAYWRYKEKLENSGVIFLVNENCRLNWYGHSEILYGLEIPAECYARLRGYHLTAEEIEIRLGKADPEAYRILLAHNPGYVKMYQEWGADLILSGHLHGGIIRLPGIGGVVDPQAGVFPRYSGSCYREGSTSIVVSKGLGTHTVNIRLFNPAELIVLHVQGEGQKKEEF